MPKAAPFLETETPTGIVTSIIADYDTAGMVVGGKPVGPKPLNQFGLAPGGSSNGERDEFGIAKSDYVNRRLLTGCHAAPGMEPANYAEIGFVTPKEHYIQTSLSPINIATVWEMDVRLLCAWIEQGKWADLRAAFQAGQHNKLLATGENLAAAQVAHRASILEWAGLVLTDAKADLARGTEEVPVGLVMETRRMSQAAKLALGNRVKIAQEAASAALYLPSKITGQLNRSETTRKVVTESRVPVAPKSEYDEIMAEVEALPEGEIMGGNDGE